MLMFSKLSACASEFYFYGILGKVENHLLCNDLTFLKIAYYLTCCRDVITLPISGTKPKKVEDFELDETDSVEEIIDIIDAAIEEMEEVYDYEDEEDEDNADRKTSKGDNERKSVEIEINKLPTENDKFAQGTENAHTYHIIERKNEVAVKEILNKKIDVNHDISAAYHATEAKKSEAKDVEGSTNDLELIEEMATIERNVVDSENFEEGLEEKLSEEESGMDEFEYVGSGDYSDATTDGDLIGAVTKVGRSSSNTWENEDFDHGSERTIKKNEKDADVGHKKIKKQNKEVKNRLAEDEESSEVLEPMPRSDVDPKRRPESPKNPKTPKPEVSTKSEVFMPLSASSAPLLSASFSLFCSILCIALK